MNTATAQTKAPTPPSTNRSTEILNAFTIANQDQLRWPARIYRFRPIHGRIEDQRRAIRDAVWSAKKLPGSSCRGYSFVVDLDEERVAVCSTWHLPEGEVVDNFKISFEEEIEINADEPRFVTAFARIIKDGLKLYFKNNVSDEIGQLWQDFNSFCETPSSRADISESGFLFCRRYDFDAKPMANGWCVKFNASTSTIDAKAIQSYYEEGNVEELGDRILSKLENRAQRNGKPVAIRIWYGQQINGRLEGKVYELSNPSQILDDAKLPPQEQQKRALLSVPCKSFPNGQVSLDGKRCFLLLDAAITRDEHDETIIDPWERDEIALKLRDFVNGAAIFGTTIELAKDPLEIGNFANIRVVPPPVFVRDSNGVRKIGNVVNPTPESLLERGRERQRSVRNFGFYESCHINPVLAVPEFLGPGPADELLHYLNGMLDDRGISYRFAKAIRYKSVSEIEREVKTGRYDSLLAVLDQRYNTPQHEHDTHEQIKQMVPVPSQCIHHYNIFYRKHRQTKLRDLANVAPRDARRIENQLDLCIGNLLVKCHWFPFLPAAAFNYKVHLAFDVGGKQNNHVMACLGMGFGNPSNGLLFRPESIPLHSRQAEPIHPDALFNGFLRLLESTAQDLEQDKEQLDLNSFLIFRDGLLLGSGDEWNEQDALLRLHAEALKRGWCDTKALWTAVEISKAAEGWRVMSCGDSITNPTVGFSCFPFPNENEGLVCTTGQPYLHQGTASPLKINIVNIAGNADRNAVVRDLVWEADMCFTKLDMGFSLPLTLQIADSGALQLSKRYKISGVTL